MTEKVNNIKVFVRVRPLSQMQTQNEGTMRCIDAADDRYIRVVSAQGPSPNFAYDRVFPEQTKQEEVFDVVADNVVNSAFEGINGTIFCYGQTSSGKTFTCVGPQINGNKRGLLPRIIGSVMQRIRDKPSNIDLRAKVSLIEIYNEKVTDLLDLTRRNLKLRQNRQKGVFIQHVTERYISKAEEGYQLLILGLENRKVGFTQMNAASSRSHMLFMITILQNDFQSGQAKSAKLTIIDLAGSQKISKTNTEGRLLSEAIKINTSLSALGNVIHALSQGKGGHVPYRDSKLTRLLQESLGGNAQTSLIVNVSPSTFNEAQTITSLRFGQRAKSVKNSPKINKQYTVQQLMSLLEKAQLKIKAQSKMIDELTKKKRVGGYGFIQQKPITLHIINDEDDAQSVVDSCQGDQTSNNHIEKRPSIQRGELLKKNQNSRKNLFKLASSLKCIPNGQTKKKSTQGQARQVRIVEDRTSQSTEENLLQDVEQRVIARTRSQAQLMANRHQDLLQSNITLKDELQKAVNEARNSKQALAEALQSIQLMRSQIQIKQETIAKKNIMIQRLKQKNKQRKIQIEKEINNLKRFWQNYQTDQQQKIKEHRLRSSDSTATINNRVTTHKRVHRVKTQCSSSNTPLI